MAWFAIGAAFLLSDCATTPVGTSDARTVPPARVLSTDYITQRAGTCLVVVKRDSGFGGSACSSRVFVDGQAVAGLATGEKVSLYVTPGEHIIGANPNGICGGGLSEVSIVAHIDRPSILRIRYGSNGDYSIQPTAM